MNQLLVNLITRTQRCTPLRNKINPIMQKIEFMLWKNRGRDTRPPHIIKQRVIRSFAETYGLRILVETGTYYGDMVEAMKHCFDRIYSIELSEDLYERATKRFSKEKKIEIIHGDSGIELGKLITRLDQPTLFWLDGHYSAGVTAKGEKVTPIYEELDHIFNTGHSEHAVIIDDARCFGTDPYYPTIEALCEYIKSRKPGARIEIEYDSVRIIPSDEVRTQ